MGFAQEEEIGLNTKYFTADLRCVVGSFIASFTIGCSSPAEVTSPPPPSFSNLVVVMIDALRSDSLDSYGGTEESGPFLTQVADEGRPLQGYSASSWTRPSVATLMTGLYPQRHQVLARTDGLGSNTPYLPELLSLRGITTAAIVTNGNLSQLFGFSRGFDHFELNLGKGKPRAGDVVDKALHLAAKLEPPFFYYIHFMEPHSPYLPSSRSQSEHGETRPYIQPKQLLAGVVPFTVQNVERLRDRYIGEIRELDPELERLVDGLDTLGLLEDTLVVVTADHGEEFGEHGGLSHGFTLYEEVVRVPMILWSKDGLPPGSSNANFHQVDFTPTVFEALGQEIPAGIDGRSRWASIWDPEWKGSDDLLFHLDLDGARVEALTSPPFKVVRQLDGSGAKLFNLVEDPLEQNTPLSNTSDLKVMESRLDEYRTKLRSEQYEPEDTVLTRNVREQLEALGYLGAGDQ